VPDPGAGGGEIETTMAPALVLTLVLAGLPPPASIHWEKNFDEAMKRARREKKPVIVDFWADWCGWCHRLDSTTYADPIVAEKAKDFVAVKVDTEGGHRDREVRDRYRVNNLPTIVFLTPNGRQILRVNGFQGPGRFPRTLEEALEVEDRLGVWEEDLERDPNDAEALFALGQHLFDQECYQESEDLLERAAAHDRDRPLMDRRRTRLLLAILQNVRRRYAEAETLIKEALSLGAKGEDEAKLLFILGHTYVVWGRRAEGVQTMQAIVREYPQSPLAQKARETLVGLEHK
jgi:thiol-disulfide isomerase/thioredoxin